MEPPLAYLGGVLAACGPSTWGYLVVRHGRWLMSDEVGGIGDRRRGKDSSLDSVNKITSDLGKYRRKYINSYSVEASVQNRCT